MLYSACYTVRVIQCVLYSACYTLRGCDICTILLRGILRYFNQILVILEAIDVEIEVNAVIMVELNSSLWLNGVRDDSNQLMSVFVYSIFSHVVHDM